VSCNSRVSVATGEALTDVHAGASASPPTEHLSHALSDDGRYVFFSTQEALVPEDSNGKWDAYEYDTATGTVHLISSGKDPADSYFLDASPDGRNVFFATREQLLGWDVDQNYDLYDARVGGGLPEPVPATPPCSGETCRGAPAGAPGSGVPGTQLFDGAGNATPPPATAPRALTKAQKLARALRACQKRSKSQRKRCRSRAGRQFGKKASKSKGSS